MSALDIEQVRKALIEGRAIPAHPLALDKTRKLDERRQRALTRYYLEAGAGGVAVGVHTTQFEIRQPRHGLFEPVLRLAVATARECDSRSGRRSICVSGICGPTGQAVREGRLAAELGYDAGLISLGALRSAGEAELIAHCEAVAREIPLFGFYLQPAVGGRPLSRRFWSLFAEIPGVVAVKVAPFNRYQTLDVVRGVAEAGRAGEIALYTGNDDAIVWDLVSVFEGEGGVRQFFSGGLLGHWACWTLRAVELLHECRAARQRGAVSAELLVRAAEVTDCNAAFFDAANGFAGCIAGIHEVLRGQGLLENRHCLNPAEDLSAGQLEEIGRVRKQYRHLADDDYVAANLDRWMG